MAKKTEEDFQVVLSAKRLLELTELTRQVPELQKETEKLRKQVLALRIIQQQCIEEIGELKKTL